MKRIIKRLVMIIMFVLALSFGSKSAGAKTVVESGQCGENVFWELDDEGTLTISGTGAMEDIFCNEHTIEKVIIGYGVTSISDYAFDGCEMLSSVKIPGSVTSIGKSAFGGCKQLSSIEIPEGVVSIGDWTFFGCEMLSSVKIPGSVTSIGDWAFSDCEQLSSIEIPEGVVSIGASAFEFCSALSSVKIPEGVTSISDYAFYGCEQLSSIEIPEGVTEIGEGTFCGTGITSVIVPKTVNTIGDRALGYYCTVPDMETIVWKLVDDYVIYGYADSTAENYANENGITFVCLDGKYAKIKAFAERLYTKALGRASDEAGVDFWTEMLVSEEYTAAQAAASFIFGPEFVGQNNSDEVFLDRLYATFFDRAADPSGKEYWLSYLQGGVTREYVTAQFVNSAEFEAVCAEYGMQRGSIGLSGYVNYNPNLTMYVVRCYREIHGREADPSGLEFWCETIATKQRDATHVARSFVDSQEFIDRNLSNEDYLEVLYRAFMGRSSDPGGLAYWLGRLENGTSRLAALDEFANCPEFWGILESFGL